MVRAGLIGWPSGVPKEHVEEFVRVTVECPGAMMSDDVLSEGDKEALGEALAVFARAMSSYVQRRSGVKLQWEAEGRYRVTKSAKPTP